MSDRDIFAECIPTGGMFVAGLARRELKDMALRGLEAAAGLWFDEHEDEDALPPELVEAYRFIQFNLIHDDVSDLYSEAIWGDEA